MSKLIYLYDKKGWEKCWRIYGAAVLERMRKYDARRTSNESCSHANEK